MALMPTPQQDESPWGISTALIPFPRDDGSAVPLEEADAADWARVLTKVQRAGFAAVDLTDVWLRIANLSPARLEELRGVLDHLGLSVPSVSLVRCSVIDSVDGERNVDYTLRALDAAASLGTGVVSLGLHQALTPAQRSALWFWTVPGHSDPDDAEIRALAASRIRTIAEHAAELGIEVSLEMYEDTYLGSADSAVALLEQIDHPAVGLNPDLGNLVRAHGPVEDWEEILVKTLPHTNFWHVKNYYRMEDPQSGVVLTTPAPMESGFINYRRALELAVDAGFDGWLCVEHYGGDGLSVARTNADYLTRLMKEIRA